MHNDEMTINAKAFYPNLGEVIWITGNSGAGKTTLAKLLQNDGDIWLDGDIIREHIIGFGLNEQDRRNHNLTTAKWAKMLAEQGHRVIVSLICPYEDLRQEVRAITGCKFIYIGYDRDNEIPDKPYERPKDADLVFWRGGDKLIKQS